MTPWRGWRAATPWTSTSCRTSQSVGRNRACRCTANLGPVNDDVRRSIAYQIALGRIAFGVGLAAAPAVVARAYLGAEAQRPSIRYVNRIFGGRDVALGIVLLQALREGRREKVNRALLLGAGCDAWDAVAAVRSRELPIWSRLVVAILGSTFAALGAAAALAPPPDPAKLASVPTSA
jgi:hypothetical protein